MEEEAGGTPCQCNPVSDGDGARWVADTAPEPGVAFPGWVGEGMRWTGCPQTRV